MRTEDGYIIYRCLNGDSTAFGFLVDKYKAGVYAFAYERLHNFHDAEDIAQEVFLKAYKSLRTLRRWDSFASWLYRIALNLCRNWIRAQSSRPDHGFIEDQGPELLENHSKDLYRQELACESVREALDSLPEMYSQVLNLHYLGGMTSMEIARFVGVSSAAVRKRLSKARSLLKEEILAMMSTTFEKQKLQSTFTFRIVDAVKKMKIHPTPRTGGLPWGLSLATGLIFAVLSLVPQPGIFNSVATGSPLPSETKVLKTGEIPVDILKVSEIPIIANRQGDGDGGEAGASDPRNAILAAAHDKENIRTQENKEVITDPKTGVKYTRTRTFTGKRDVIEWPQDLRLSPNGKFLLHGKLVLPLDRGDPFELVDMPADSVVWSPDGKQVSFASEGGIWVIPVSPETGRPTGPAEKLMDGGLSRWDPRWSPDGEKLVFSREGDEGSDDIWTLSVKDGALTQVTDDPLNECAPRWSHDGKTIVYGTYKRGLRTRWQVSAEGGTPRKISFDEARFLSFSRSPDGKWRFYRKSNPGNLLLFRLADKRVFEIDPPDGVGYFLSMSPDGKKMLFYSSSYNYTTRLKVVSVSGGPSFELGSQFPLSTLWPYQQYWSPDSRMITAKGFNKEKEGDWSFWMISLAGGEPLPLELHVSVDGEAEPCSLSPDGKKLLFVVYRSDKTVDIYVVPVSLEDARTTGPAVMVFSGRDKRPIGGWKMNQWSWSPDGSRFAVIHGGDIWITSTEEGKPVQITETPEREIQPVWSPDGDMIAYRLRLSELAGEGRQILHVIPASGGEATEILDTPASRGQYAWSPDSKEIAVISEGMISAIPIAGGKARQILDLEHQGFVKERTWGLCWLPDGKYLAFITFVSQKAGGDDDRTRIFMVPAEGGKVAELATDDDGWKDYLFPSPDGKWISYDSEAMVKTRSEGAIWEADLSELLSGGEREQ